MLLQELLALAAVCKVLTETILGGIRVKLTTTDSDGTTHLSISTAAFEWLSLLISLIVAILANEVAGLNLLANTSAATRVSPDVAILLTGVALGFGSNVVNELFGIFEGWHDRATTPVSTSTATVTTNFPAGTAVPATSAVASASTPAVEKVGS